MQSGSRVTSPQFTFDVRHFHIHVEAILDTTNSVKVHKLFNCFTNNGVYSLHIDTCVFLRLLPRVLSLLTEWTLVLFGKS